jgi:hypothetical protein
MSYLLYLGIIAGMVLGSLVWAALDEGRRTMKAILRELDDYPEAGATNERELVS